MLTTEQKNGRMIAAEHLRKLSVLFVEDDDEARDNLTHYLARRFGHVYTGNNGRVGLEAYREQRPDLIISDIRMAEMDGLAMCRAIREADSNIPLILISAHNESDMLISSIDLGVAKFLVKPVDTDVLNQALNHVAESLEHARTIESQLRYLDALQQESDYAGECVRDYVSHYLDAHRHEELDNIRYLNVSKLEISGDFYCVEKYRDDLYVLLADGAGHGLPAVIPALQIPKIFQQRAARGFSLLAIAEALNRYLREQNIAQHFVAATLVRLNPVERYVEVLNCGNPPLFIFDEAGGLLHICHSRAAALGVVGAESFSVEVERFRIERNARLYLFTDGLVDTLRMISSEADSERILQEWFCKCLVERQFDELTDEIREISRQYRIDDIALLEVRYDQNSGKTAAVESSAVEIPMVQASSLPSLEQVTLLFVEDDRMARDYLANFLNRRFGMVHVAQDGQEGLALFIKHRPQIVLSDIKMPYMDGMAMAAEIRKLDRQVPIIVISGSDHAEDAERMFELGVSRFHLKPLDPGKLIGTIQNCLRHFEELERLQLAASVFEDSSLAVVTVDKERRIVAVNPAFCRITAYAREELLGHSPVWLSSGKRDVSHYQQMWRELDQNGNWSGELMCQLKNGTTVSSWVTVNEAKSNRGETMGYHLVFADYAERRSNEEMTRQLTLHDSLTHLPNRELFAEKCNELLSRKMSGTMALLHLDIDHFMEINNILGVRIGDEVLLAVGQRLASLVRADEVACRLGGDEFALLISRLGGRDDIERTVVDLSGAIKQTLSVRDHEIQVSTSIGIALVPTDGVTYEELVKSASSAINQAQLAGGDTYRFFDKSISEREIREVALQQDIKLGLNKNQFYMLYQPKYSLSQHRVVGAEALVRWKHPVFGGISPTEFIPLAEKSGAVIELSEWIIDTVCAQIADWRKIGFPSIPVAINISPVHFWRGDLVGALRKGLQKWNLRPAHLQIEVTEGVVMDNSEKTLQALAELKALGFHLSIDDFGTGYSSLKYLKDLPISELKIDRSFIAGIPEEGQMDDIMKTAIPRAIIQLASELKLTVVAEGVETESQRDFLVENGCDVIQGYLISRPLPAQEFALLLS